MRCVECEQVATKLNVSALRDVNPPQLERARADFDPVVFRRARHVITEINRTLAVAEAINHGNWDRVGGLMEESHASLRDGFQVSCEELDLLIELVTAQEGVYGSRMTGGGFGGCTVSLVKRDACDAVTCMVRDGYHRRTGLDPDLFVTGVTGGSHIIENLSCATDLANSG